MDKVHWRCQWCPDFCGDCEFFKENQKVAAKTFQVEVELKAVVNLLAYSEEDAQKEALNVANNVCHAAARAGLIMEVRAVKPRQLIAQREVP